MQSQSSKEQMWLKQNADSAELEIDEATLAEMAGDSQQVPRNLCAACVTIFKILSLKSSAGTEFVLPYCLLFYFIQTADAIEASEAHQSQNTRKLQAMRSQLQALLAVPLPVNGATVGGNKKEKTNRKNRKATLVSNISSVNLRKGKGRGLFVFAK